MSITIIGTGYVGLTTGTCLAELGNTVICIDIDEEKIKRLQQGIIPIYEPGLEALVQKNLAEGRLTFSTDAVRAIKESEIVFSAVGTPPDKSFKADLSAVKAVAKTFGQSIEKYSVFVNKSTVPVGTSEMVHTLIADEIKNRGVKVDFDVVDNPEFLREGSAVNDTMHPDRVVIGASSKKAYRKVARLYKPMKTKILFTDIRSAEIIKYAANSFLAMKISFINEIADFCDLTGGNIEKIAEGIGLDKRIGKSFLNAGAGYGGSCFPKDVAALIQTGKEHDFDFSILRAVEEVNAKQKEVVFDKLVEKMPDLKGKRIAVLGLAFKPRTDDMRDAPSLVVVQKLIDAGADVIAYDPAAGENAKRYFPSLAVVQTLAQALRGADASVILTEWDDVQQILLETFHLMKGTIVIDGRNVCDPATMINDGFNYSSIGRPL